MEGEVKIYYGMSGTFKTTTIQATKKSSDLVVRSRIKVWKGYRDKLFPWLFTESNLNYALLHLTQLEEARNWKSDILIERGISDMLFYELISSPETINSETIIRAINQESKIFGNRSIQKILLIMNDTGFIADTILSEPTRGKWFSDVNDYLRKQEEYIEFTKTNNNIDTEIKIENAKDYLGKLGIITL